jgi:hypothetical protein
MLPLPSEGQNFIKIRKNNLLYVDKTEYIHKIIQTEGCFFLSRPRRFGKSLLLEAMGEILKGNRKLFKGLWIDSCGYDFQKYPVVQLTMTGDSDTAKLLKETIMDELQGAAQDNGMALESDNPIVALNKMVATLKTKTKKRVAVLIDECNAQSAPKSAISNKP